MKKGRFKKILLAVLAVIMVVIWWDALRTMYPDTVSYKVTTPTGASAEQHAEGSQLPYAPPKINPFRRYIDSPQSSPQRAQTPAKPTPPPRLNIQYSLSGIVRRGPQSQAVITTADGSSRVLSIADSLDVWELIAIEEDLIVFEHAKQKDTLWLYSEAE